MTPEFDPHSRDALVSTMDRREVNDDHINLG